MGIILDIPRYQMVTNHSFYRMVYTSTRWATKYFYIVSSKLSITLLKIKGLCTHQLGNGVHGCSGQNIYFEQILLTWCTYDGNLCWHFYVLMFFELLCFSADSCLCLSFYLFHNCGSILAAIYLLANLPQVSTVRTIF